MIQFKKITTSKSVLLFLIFLTTTTHCFLQNDHRETSRRSNDRENRNFPERRQVGKNLNTRNMAHKFDEKDRMYENLYDRRSFRTGTPEKSGTTERRILGFSSNNIRREVRSDFAERNDNRASVNNRQRFSVDQIRNAESYSRNRNVNDNGRYMNRIDLNHVNRRYVARNERFGTRSDFENRRQIAVDRRINSVIPSIGKQSRAFSSRSDSTRQNARIQFEREDKRDARTLDARVIVSSRNSRLMNEISRTDSTVNSRENARMFNRRENINSRSVINQTPQHRQERNKLFRSDMSRRMPEISQTRNTFENRLPQENRRDSTRNRLTRISNSNNSIRNVPTIEYTRSDFGINSRNGNEHLRENMSRKSSTHNLRNTFATQVRRVVPVKHTSPSDDVRFDKSANVPQLKVSNSYAVRYLPEKDISPGSAELREKSIGIQSSQESYEYLKLNRGINSWANAAQVILGIYLIGQIFLNSSMKNKPRFHMFAVGSMKDKMH